MLATIKNETRLNALKKTLKKADLGYIDGFIVIRDEKRWTAVPIRPRIPMRMSQWGGAIHSGAR
jgi:hypothetical protein